MTNGCDPVTQNRKTYAKSKEKVVGGAVDESYYLLPRWRGDLPNKFDKKFRGENHAGLSQKPV